MAVVQGQPNTSIVNCLAVDLGGLSLLSGSVISRIETPRKRVLNHTPVTSCSIERRLYTYMHMML